MIRKLIPILSLTLLAGGCVTGTRTIELNLPETNAPAASKGSVYIGEIRDNRKFEQKPTEASVPSVRGDLASTTPDQLSKLIGRQRNGFGKAMGDIMLANGATAQQEVRRLLEAGFTSRGYQVSTSTDANVSVSADIEKFWGWFHPGFMAFGFESDIECEVSLTSDTLETNVRVVGKGLNKGQVANNANWQLSFYQTYGEFLKSLDTALEEAGF